MNIFNRQNLTISLFVATSVMLSVNATAQQVSLEQLLTHKVQVQGQKVANDLNLQVQQSIQNSLQAFSVNATQQWLTEADTEIALASNKKEPRNFTSKSATE